MSQNKSKSEKRLQNHTNNSAKNTQTGRKVALTFDVECDCPPFLSSTKNITLGLPKILDVMNEFDIRATFFVTGNIAKKYPKVIKNLSKRHEIGSHGYNHEMFDEITLDKKKKIIKSKKLLEKLTGEDIVGFRAPYLKVSNELYKILEEHQFRYDSSIGTFMRSHKNIKVTNIAEFKLEIPNVILRFPAGLRKFKKVCLKSTFPVLFFHPWEAMDMRKLLPRSFKNYYMRLDNWYHTGDRFIERLRALFEMLTSENFEFVMLRDMV